MEASPEHPTHPATPVGRPTDGAKTTVKRIGSQTKGLFEDFTEWVELRLELFQLEVQERVKKKVDAAIIKAAPIVVGLLAGFFLLITVALFVGWWLGHPAWGFLVVTSLLLLLTGMLYARSKRLDGDDGGIDVTTASGESEGGSR